MDVKVVSGILCAHSDRGLHPLKNPSERRTGSYQFKRICVRLRRWKVCARRLAQEFSENDEVHICSVLEIFKYYKLGFCDGKKKYKNIRLVRALSAVSNTPLVDDEVAWICWRDMSKHVASVCRETGIYSYQNAIRFRDALRHLTQQHDYNLNDLICFVCLQHRASWIED